MFAGLLLQHTGFWQWLYMSNISSIYKIMEKALVNTADIHLMRWLMVFCKCQTMEVYLKKWNHSQIVLGAHMDLQTLCNNSVSPHQRPQHTDGKPLLLPIHTSSIQLTFRHGHKKTPEGLLWWLTCLWSNYTSHCLLYTYIMVSFFLWTDLLRRARHTFCEFWGFPFCTFSYIGCLWAFGLSEETSFCEVQLNYNTKVHFMAALFYKTWGVMNVEVYHSFYCVLNIFVKLICWGLKLWFARTGLVLSCVKFVTFTFLNCLSSFSSL